MLRLDPFICKNFPQYIPSDEEVAACASKLESDLSEDEYKKFCDRVVVNGDKPATVARMAWQAKQGDGGGSIVTSLDGVTAGACAAARRALGARARFGLDDLPMVATERALCDVRLSREELEAEELEAPAGYEKSSDSVGSSGSNGGGGVMGRFRGPQEQPASFSMEEAICLYRRAVPFSVHGCGKQRQPIVIQRWGKADLELLDKLGSVSVRLQLRLHEFVTRVRIPYLSAGQTEPETRDRVLFIFDLAGCGMRMANRARKIMGPTSKPMAMCFPETLGRTVVVNAPWIAAKLFDVAKGFLHQVTASKIALHYNKDDATKELLGLVDSSELPPWLGGTCACEECGLNEVSGGAELRHWEGRGP